MSPEYFMHTLTFWEAVLFAKGVHRRYHKQWETARYIAFYAAKPHCKNFQFDNMGQFPWEKEENSEPPLTAEQQAEELKALRERIRIRDEQLYNNDKQWPQET